MMRGIIGRLSPHNGGIGIRLLFVAVTLVVVAVSVLSLLEAQRDNARQHHRIAAELSDLAMQKVLEQNAAIAVVDPSKFAPIPRTEAQNGWYEVTVTVAVNDTAARIGITSQGVCGAERVTQSRAVTLRRDTTDTEAPWKP